jgi:hypothetical protein
MTSKRIDDLDVDTLRDEELDAELKHSSVIVYGTSGGLVVVSIAGEEITPKCAADALRAMAEGIERKRHPQNADRNAPPLAQFNAST